LQYQPQCLNGPTNLIPFATKSRLAGLLFGACLACTVCHAQSLAPRAYLITPVQANALTMTFAFYDGGVEFNGSVPITGATARTSVPTLSLYHTVNLFGRSANITAALPYSVGHFYGKVGVVGAERNAYRSGLLDAQFRFSVNLKGGPAMSAKEFSRWRQKLLIGTSLTVVAPTGQYYPSLLINLGANRWAFKPELGLSQRWGHWILDAYGGVWFFTTNPEFFSHNHFNPGTIAQSEKPVGAFEAHLSYNIKNNQRFWFSLDANYWYGGRTSLNGVENPVSLQANSRIGATLAVPITRHQSLKFSYSDGSIIRYGGDYQNVSVAWQYSWLGRRAGNTLP
jgi:hypothetical protein